VLTLDKENVKALLRRGIAYEELADYNNALDDMCTIMRVDPSQKSVADSMERLLSYISGTAKPPTKTTKKVIKKVAQELKKKMTQQKSTEKEVTSPVTSPVVVVENVAPAAPVATSTAMPPTPPVVEVAAVPVVSIEAKLKAAEELKQKGNAAFKGKKYSKAALFYTQAFNMNPSNAAVLGNRAMAHLKLNQNEEVVRDCTKGLQILLLNGKTYIIYFLMLWWKCIVE